MEDTTIKKMIAIIDNLNYGEKTLSQDIFFREISKGSLVEYFIIMNKEYADMSIFENNKVELKKLFNKWHDCIDYYERVDKNGFEIIKLYLQAEINL